MVFTSCSSDDDGGSQDPFIGNWMYHKYLEDGVEVTLEECENLTTLKISSNGTFITKVYENLGTGCELEYTSTGTWENLGSGIYSTTSDGDTYVQEVGFSGNTMYFEEVDNGVIYRDVFIRQ